MLTPPLPPPMSAAFIFFYAARACCRWYMLFSMFILHCLPVSSYVTCLFSSLFLYFTPFVVYDSYAWYDFFFMFAFAVLPEISRFSATSPSSDATFWLPRRHFTPPVFRQLWCFSASHFDALCHVYRCFCFTLIMPLRDYAATAFHWCAKSAFFRAMADRPLMHERCHWHFRQRAATPAPCFRHYLPFRRWYAAAAADAFLSAITSASRRCRQRCAKICCIRLCAQLYFDDISSFIWCFSFRLRHLSISAYLAADYALFAFIDALITFAIFRGAAARLCLTIRCFYAYCLLSFISLQAFAAGCRALMLTPFIFITLSMSHDMLCLTFSRCRHLMQRADYALSQCCFQLPCHALMPC